MADIVTQRSNHKLPSVEYDCGTCGSTIRFHQTDIKYDQRDGDYVVCPICNSYISSGRIWRPKATLAPSKGERF